MKFFRTPEQRQQLEQLAQARRRAGLTPAGLADRVTASRGFALRYQSGQHDPVEPGVEQTQSTTSL